jgi:hypothetical protein
MAAQQPTLYLFVQTDQCAASQKSFPRPAPPARPMRGQKVPRRALSCAAALSGGLQLRAPSASMGSTPSLAAVYLQSALAALEALAVAVLWLRLAHAQNVLEPAYEISTIRMRTGECLVKPLPLNLNHLIPSETLIFHNKFMNVPQEIPNSLNS